jgi:hypothetical protein
VVLIIAFCFDFPAAWELFVSYFAINSKRNPLRFKPVGKNRLFGREFCAWRFEFERETSAIFEHAEVRESGSAGRPLVHRLLIPDKLAVQFVPI